MSQMTDFLSVGWINNTHGVKGEVKILPLTDDASRFYDLKWAFLDRNGTLEKVDIESVKLLKQFVILKLKGIDSMDAAEGLKGMYLKVDREHAVKLPEDSFFVSDLIGCRVFNENTDLLGELTEVLETGSNDVYVVKDGKGREVLIPALKRVVREVSVTEKKMVVCLPEGLVEYEV